MCACSDEILKRIVDAYRKIRNTLRYALGNLDGFDPENDSVAFAEMLEIDRWALARSTKWPPRCGRPRRL